MKRSTLAAVGGTAAGIAGGAMASALAMRMSRPKGPGRLLYRPADEMAFVHVVPGISRAVIWGDPDRGPYAAYTRFEPGHRNPLHTHPHDISIVVLSGAYVYSTADGEIRVGPRSYLYLPAGVPHVSSSDPKEGLLMYEESVGSFGLNYLD